MNTGDSRPAVVGQVEPSVRLDPERAEFEAAAEVRGLHTARTVEWVPLDDQTEDDRPYYNGRTDAAWWAWQTSRSAERERCIAECKAAAADVTDAAKMGAMECWRRLALGA